MSSAFPSLYPRGPAAVGWGGSVSTSAASRLDHRPSSANAAKRSMGFGRRFLNFVSRDSVKSVFTLRRIDTSRLFISNKGSNGGGRLPMKYDYLSSLPEPTISFFSSHVPHYRSGMTFMPFHDKVVGTDAAGGALIYLPDRQAVRPLPGHEKLKQWVLSQAFGDKLYVIDKRTNGTGTRAFEALVYTPSFLPDEGNWHWRALPPPPPPPGVQDSADDPTSIESCTVVAGGSRILMSAKGSGDVEISCTHSFDTERLVWSTRPVGWVLPFRGSTEYVPELNKLWFGILSREHGSVFCACDLSGASESQQQPPVLHAALEDPAPEEWSLISARAMHLGSGKFCVARIFNMTTRNMVNGHVGHDVMEFAVLTGVEVTTCSNGGEKKVSMVQHNSERYLLCNDTESHWVL